MTAVSSSSVVASRHKLRRRRPDKPAIPSHLILDDHIESDVGILSQDLFTDLFPHLENKTEDDPADYRYIAIAPWKPNASCSGSAWCIVPVIRSSAHAHSTLYFSPSSLALQSFAVTLQKIAPSKLTSHSRSGIEILILDVVAAPLETVFVSLESDVTKRLENGEGTLFQKHSFQSVARSTPSQEHLMTALRAALGTLKIVHGGDLFPLPLSPNPLTNLPSSPGRIEMCEPVAQGVLTPDTKVVLMRGRVHRRQERNTSSLSHLNSSTDNGQDTSADQFFSAVEEHYKTDVPLDGIETDMVSETETETDFSGLEQEDELSDDSLDDMISLETPELHATNINGPGTMGLTTPMAVDTLRGRRPSGVATPVSIFSNNTATTARADRPRSRLFKAYGLPQPIPSEILHPKPTVQDDEEARIYVDMSSLSKIGCFSGDWARIEIAEEPPSNGFGASELGNFSNHDGEPVNWRPVRVFGLPEGYSTPRIVSRIVSSRSDEGRMSFFESQVQRPACPAAYASPILLANLDNATHFRIAPLKKLLYPGKGTNSRLTNAAHPPYARDITIQHIRTPVSAERAYQTAVLGGLKHYFADKLRLVRTGDLIAVSVDSQLGRALQEAAGAGGSEVDDVVALTTMDQSENGCHYDGVAWFKVGHIQVQKSDQDEDESADMFWGSVACVDSSTVAMHGSGFVTSRIPGIRNSTWPYYLGLRNAPRRDGNASAPSTLSVFINDRTPPLQRQLRELLVAATSQRAIQLKMPPVAILLTSTHRNIGKTTMATRSCADVGLHTYEIDGYDILNEAGGSGGDVKTEGFLRTRAERAQSCGPGCCALLIRHIDALTADRIEAKIKEILVDLRVLIATTNNVDAVPDGVRALFTHELEMGAPDEAEREAILRDIISDRGITLDASIDLNSVALKTAALVAGDLVDVVERACLAQCARLEALSVMDDAACVNGTRPLPLTVRDLQIAGGPLARSLTAADFDVAVDAARKNFSDSIGAPKIPNVTWDDVGGLGNVKDAIKETIQLPLERPELFSKGLKKRSGILFYGPPGTGKTLLAKAIATEYSLNFFSVKGPELLNMYIGESEANVRRVFQRARDARPCVVFFDELDSVAPKRGNQGDSGGVMDRIVSQLLAELDGMSGGHDAGGVFVIGATNRPDLLDQALLRPGRFDKMLYLGVSDTHEKQRTILEALTRKFALHPSVSLASVAQQLPFTYTGADFYALCSDAMLKAVTRQAAAVDAKVRALNADRRSATTISTGYFFDHLATADDVAVIVSEKDFFEAQAELIPSVSAGELAHYEKVRAVFEGGRDDARSRKELRPGSSSSGVGGGGNWALTAGAGAGSSSALKGKGKATTTTTAVVAEGVNGTNDYGRMDEKGKGKEKDMSKAKGKGKGEAVNRGGFRDGTASDDDDLY